MAAVLESRLQDLPGARQLIQVIMLAGALALGLWLFFFVQKPDYVPLYSGLADRDAAEVSEALQAANIPFRLDVGGGISVTEAQVNEARLKLAALGLPQGGRAGFEMIEGEQGFGVSQFVEGARYQMALETELARTIAALRPVREARVHLALPKPSAFTRAREPAAASVLLELYPGRSLESIQVAAIVHLVATSIPDLQPERVTVIDQSGRMLTVPDPNSDDAINTRQFEQVQRLQNDYAARIARLLEPLTGPGRVSAQVSVDMDFSIVEEARETFTPDPTKLRSEQTAEETSSTSDTRDGIPGATSNTPPTGEPTQGGNPDASGAQSAARSATRNFELDRTVSHSRQSVGRVKRVTAAVLVDNIPEGADAEGNPVLRPMTEEEIARIQSLVREAIGFNAERGDSVSVVNAGFAKPEPLGEIEALPIWENPTYISYARIALGFIAVMAFIMVVLRPAVRNIVSPEPPPALPVPEEEAQTEEEAFEEAQARAALGHEGTLGPGGVAGGTGMTAEQEAQGILAGPGNFEQRLTVVRAAVQQDPRRVAQLVRGWVNADG